jgi:eukaryotic-like serine/threonine-protein kinase
MTVTIDRLAAALADRYRIERELGAGGMATVYLAYDLRHDRQVAIKVMRAEVSAELVADRFLLEIRTTANLQHPHIVPVFDSGIVPLGQPEIGVGRPDLLFYVMPRIEGESLRDRLDREGPLPVGDALRLMREVAGALDYAHGQGVLHRDLKPENILLSRGHALLADFGIARAAGPGGRERLTQAGMLIGTPAYMSPEQAMGERELSPASDIYALGAIVYELLVGEPPFTGPTFAAILAKRFTGEAPRLRSRRADTPAACDNAVSRALAREPAARFATARDFADALGPARPGEEARGRHQHSLAVLPFDNLSADADNGYFADGLTEEVITTLSKVGTLRVISRTTMMQFRDRTQALGEVARQLDVTHVLEGSVRKAGDRLRISASLVAAASDASLWSDRFDGVLADVFDMQDRVAAAIVRALDVALTPVESRRLAERPLDNAGAYDHYLRARQALNEFSMSGVERAFGHLEDALALAPDNVLLLRGLGLACYYAANTGERPDREELLERALEYAGRIEQHEPGSPYGAEIRGLVATLHGDVAEALRQLGVAYEQLPQDHDVACWYALQLAYSGRGAAAIAIARAVVRTAPDHPLACGMEALGLMLTGRHAAAVARISTAPANLPASVVILFAGLAHLAAGDRDSARDAFHRAAASEADVFTVMGGFLEHAVRGDTAAARRMLAPEIAVGIWKDFQYSEYVAQGFVLLGEVEESARWLEQSVRLGFGAWEAVTLHSAVWRPWLSDPRLVPVLESLRGNAERYAQLPVAPRALALVAEQNAGAVRWRDDGAASPLGVAAT